MGNCWWLAQNVVGSKSVQLGGLSAVEEAAGVYGLDGDLGHWYHALQEAIEHCTDSDVSPAREAETTEDSSRIGL